ncbi:MAG: leucine--tRNA ligase [Candidatus Marinimicrobia bacterium]|nr:leucine--tRNA ligase [Candidatus Neomarinimicrobiota bacterium]
MYPFKEIEKKWQKEWLNKSSKKDLSNFKNKYYCLTMFSYPSGDKLHIGHWYNYGPTDTLARYKKMCGFDVFQPQGFDAFGLPAENFAIKNNIHPAISTQKNIETMRSQLDSIGAMYDWENIVTTCEKEYYKWTQWLFLKLYKHNLAYRKRATVNWDPVDQTVLANEQVLSDGTSERSGALVEQKPLEQWFFKITDYAEELLNFNELDWPKKTVLMQKNWIGKSEGATIRFKVDGSPEYIEVFTTRPDTLYGATYIVVSPEHPLAKQITQQKKKQEVSDYIQESSRKSDLQRTDLNKNKTGVFTGSYALNPVNNKKIPIWIGDYVLITYGTGAIMAVPGHDQRDFEFAKKYSLEILQVVDGLNVNIENEPFTDKGTAVNSDIINGLSTNEAKAKMISYIEQNTLGLGKINYKLKDWLISRQRYWGTPIPIVYDPSGNPHPIPSKYLPWELPDDVEYKPKGTSPLGTSEELISRTEKIFGKGWRPEIDTMDTFVCSSWYYLRYADNLNSKKSFKPSIINKMMPVDMYVGGAEHATMHLLYARFVTKALRDMGYLDFDEPFKKLYHQGTITKDGAKMSKSKGNTVSPDVFINQYGSDVFRCYLMFMGPYDEGGDWNDRGITGIAKFLNRIYSIADIPLEKNDKNIDKIVHKTLKSVTEDLNSFKFNTAISRMMEMSSSIISSKALSEKNKSYIYKMIAPFAPHLGEELWRSDLNNDNSIFESEWPKYDPEVVIDSTINIAVQVNGKLRGSIEVDKGINKEVILSMSKNIDNVKKYIDSGALVKEIYVPGKIVNFVIKP